MIDRERLLDELGLAFARAAVDALLAAESTRDEKGPEGAPAPLEPASAPAR